AYRAHMNWTPIFFHGAVVQITGYKEKDFISGKPRWDQVIVPEDFKKIKDSAKKIATVPNYSTDREYRIIRKDGRHRWVHEMCQNVCDEKGKPKFVLGALHDITDRKEAEARLIEERNRAELYLDVLGHDINNLNQAIMTTNELLLMKNRLSGEEQDLVRNTLQQSIRISEIILNLRHLSTLKDRKFKFKKINAFKVLNNSIHSIRQTFPGRNIIVNHTLPKNKIFVKGNELMQRVYDNILVNAVKFDKHDEVVIDISYGTSKDKKFWRFEFKDNGPGIPDSMKPNIFKRLVPGSKDTIHGSGLGLTIVHEIITRYGGSVWVEDRIKGKSSKGSNFVVLLPKAK
ncbi:PAS domain-containing sensor histidine kinase, partial [[Eubacterium] cellulosolvens]